MLLCLELILTTFFQVRHAQGIHNVDGEKNYKAYMSHDYFDAELTQLGWQQVYREKQLHLHLFVQKN